MLAEDGIAEWAKDNEKVEQKRDAVNKDTETETVKHKGTEPVSHRDATDTEVNFI